MYNVFGLKLSLFSFFVCAHALRLDCLILNLKLSPLYRLSQGLSLTYVCFFDSSDRSLNSSDFFLFFFFPK